METDFGAKAELLITAYEESPAGYLAANLDLLYALALRNGHPLVDKSAGATPAATVLSGYSGNPQDLIIGKQQLLTMLELEGEESDGKTLADRVAPGSEGLLGMIKMLRQTNLQNLAAGISNMFIYARALEENDYQPGIEEELILQQLAAILDKQISREGDACELAGKLADLTAAIRPDYFSEATLALIAQNQPSEELTVNLVEGGIVIEYQGGELILDMPRIQMPSPDDHQKLKKIMAVSDYIRGGEIVSSRIGKKLRRSCYTSLAGAALWGVTYALKDQTDYETPLALARIVASMAIGVKSVGTIRLAGQRGEAVNKLAHLEEIRSQMIREVFPDADQVARVEDK